MGLKCFALVAIAAFTVTCPDKATFLSAAGMIGGMGQFQEHMEQKGVAPDVAAGFVADRWDHEFAEHGCTFDDKMPTKTKT